MNLPLISYAQNFEDVMLWRALRDVKAGFYIDIGAHAPRVDSVSRLFYEHGWRGIHVEPLPVYCNALRDDRPDETVIQAAVAEQTGVLGFYEIPDTGISTASAEIAEAHRLRGFHINEVVVPSVTLEQIFALAQEKAIHWLKIDVEGLEGQVLKGWGHAAARPWVVVVESTLPLTQQESYDGWEHYLLKRGYTFVYFDGLNRFYLAEAHHELSNAFNAGPNVFDGFSLSGQANSQFCDFVQESLRSEHKRHAQQLVSEKDQLNQQLIELEKAGQVTFQQALNRQDQLQQAQAENAQLHQLRLQEMQAHQEREHTANNQLLLAVQQNHGETQALLEKLAQREQEFTRQLVQLQQEARNDERRQAQALAGLQLKIESAQSEKLKLEREQRSQIRVMVQQHDETIRELRQEHLQQLNGTIQREQAFTQQLLGVHEQTAKQAVEQLRHHADNLRTLHREQIEAQQRQAQQHASELSAKESEHRQHLIQSHTVLQTQLQTALMAERQTVLKLGETLAGVQHALAITHASITWRMTAPVRKFARLFAQGKSTNPAAESANAAVQVAGDSSASGARAAPSTPLRSSTNVQQVPVDSALNPSFLDTTIMHSAIATTLEELLVLHDQQFIVCAYQTLLGRAPDPEGLTYYLARLRMGSSKVQILAQLRMSTEGKRHAVKLPGLDKAIRAYQRGRNPVTGWLYRLFNAAEGNNPTERKLRSIENQIFLIGEESSRRFNQLESALARLNQLYGQHEKPNPSEIGSTSVVMPQNTVTVEPTEADTLMQFSGRARKIYFELKAAANRSLRGQM